MKCKFRKKSQPNDVHRFMLFS